MQLTVTATRTSGPPAGLPRIFRKPILDVSALSDDERRSVGLSSNASIIEVIGDNSLVHEALEYARQKGKVGFDYETTGLDPFLDKIVLCQIGDQERQYLIWWDTVDHGPILELLADESIVKVGTNLKFDLSMTLAAKGFKARAWNVVDTQLIEQVLCCGLTGDIGQTLLLTNLENQVARWLGWTIPKDEDLRTGWGAIQPGRWDLVERGQEKRYYAADDVIFPLLVAEKQKPWIKQLGLVETVKLELRFLPVLAEMEVRGLSLDWDKWAVLAQEADDALVKAEQALDELFDVTQTYRVDAAGNVTLTRDKNFKSTDQLGDLIREYMKKHYGIDVICCNRHFYESLLATGRIAVARLERLFRKEKVPNPDKPGHMKWVGDPNMTDVVERLWPMYGEYLGDRAMLLLDTDSKTLKLNKIIWQTPDEQRDPSLPNRIGLPPELVDPILAHREAKTKQERYGWMWKELINPVTKRIHTNFTQAATSTGRKTSRPNFQNLPADQRYRECIVARPGYKIVGADFDQVEPRIIAEISLDPTYMRVFWSAFPGTEGFDYWCGPDVTEELDLYTEIGKLVGVIPPHMGKLDTKGDESKGIKPDPVGKKGRKQAKIIVLGLGYGTGKPKFYLTLITDTEEHHERRYSDKLWDGFWNAVPNVKRALDRCSDLADPMRSRRRIWHPYTECEVTWAETLGGRKRFFHPSHQGWWTEGRNMPVQGTGADILKRGAVEFTYWCWENDIDGGLILTAHDEYLAEIREDQAERAFEALTKIMRRAGARYCKHVPITAAGYVSDHWVKD